MPVETRLFDPATYLDTDEARAAYLTDALETADPAFIADAIGVISRARAMSGNPITSQQSPNPGTAPQLSSAMQALRALGLRLTAEPAAR